MKFWPPGGSFFNDFSTLKISLYCSVNEVVEVYWFHHGCLSICLSVCLSVCMSVRPFVCLWKSGFCTITPLSFGIQWWYLTYMLPLTQGGPLLMLGQKVKGQIWTLNFLPFPHNSSISFWHTIMILHRCIDHDLRRTFIDFGVKVKFGLKFFTIFYPFWSITPFLLAYNDKSQNMTLTFDVLIPKSTEVLIGSRLIHVLSVTQWVPLLILGSKRQRSMSYFDFKLCTVRFHTVTPFLIDILWWYYDTMIIWWGQEVKGIGNISFLNYWLFPHCNSITFWHTIMIFHTLVSYEKRRTSINLDVKRSRLNLEMLNLLPRGFSL